MKEPISLSGKAAALYVRTTPSSYFLSYAIKLDSEVKCPVSGALFMFCFLSDMTRVPHLGCHKSQIQHTQQFARDTHQDVPCHSRLLLMVSSKHSLEKSSSSS